MRSDDFEAHFRSTFALRYPELFRYLDRLTGDPALAAELAQESFVRLFDRGAMPTNIRGWLVSVAHNLHRDEQRRSSRRLRLLGQRATEDLMADPPPPTDEAVERRELRDAVRVALDALPQRDRQLLLLRHEGYSYQELASALGVAPSSVGTLLARAHAAFRASMDEKTHAHR